MKKTKYYFIPVLISLCLLTIGALIFGSNKVYAIDYSDYTEITSSVRSLTSGKYKISSEDSFINYMNLNETSCNAEVRLAEDLDFEGWQYNSFYKMVYNDLHGDNHSIKNISIVSTENYIPSYFFYSVSATIENIIFDNVKIYATNMRSTDNCCIFSSVERNGKLKNITVRNSQIGCADEYLETPNESGIVDRNYGIIDKCSFINSVAYGKVVGGIAAYNENKIVGCRVEESSIYGMGDMAGGICASLSGTINSSIVYNTNVINGYYAQLSEFNSDGKMPTMNDTLYMFGDVFLYDPSIGYQVGGITARSWYEYNEINDCIFYKSADSDRGNVVCNFGYLSIGGIVGEIGNGADSTQYYRGNIFHGEIHTNYNEYGDEEKEICQCVPNGSDLVFASAIQNNIATYENNYYYDAKCYINDVLVDISYENKEYYPYEGAECITRTRELTLNSSSELETNDGQLIEDVKKSLFSGYVEGGHYDIDIDIALDKPVMGEYNTSGYLFNFDTTLVEDIDDFKSKVNIRLRSSDEESAANSKFEIVPLRWLSPAKVDPNSLQGFLELYTNNQIIEFYDYFRDKYVNPNAKLITDEAYYLTSSLMYAEERSYGGVTYTTIDVCLFNFDYINLDDGDPDPVLCFDDSDEHITNFYQFKGTYIRVSPTLDEEHSDYGYQAIRGENYQGNAFYQYMATDLFSTISIYYSEDGVSVVYYYLLIDSPDPEYYGWDYDYAYYDYYVDSKVGFVKTGSEFNVAPIGTFITYLNSSNNRKYGFITRHLDRRYNDLTSYVADTDQVQVYYYISNGNTNSLPTVNIVDENGDVLASPSLDGGSVIYTKDNVLDIDTNAPIMTEGYFCEIYNGGLYYYNFPELDEGCFWLKLDSDYGDYYVLLEDLSWTYTYTFLYVDFEINDTQNDIIPSQVYFKNASEASTVWFKNVPSGKKLEYTSSNNYIDDSSIARNHIKITPVYGKGDRITINLVDDAAATFNAYVYESFDRYDEYVYDDYSNGMSGTIFCTVYPQADSTLSITPRAVDGKLFLGWYSPKYAMTVDNSFTLTDDIILYERWIDIKTKNITITANDRYNNLVSIEDDVQYKIVNGSNEILTNDPTSAFGLEGYTINVVGNAITLTYDFDYNDSIYFEMKLPGETLFKRIIDLNTIEEYSAEYYEINTDNALTSTDNVTTATVTGQGWYISTVYVDGKLLTENDPPTITVKIANPGYVVRISDEFIENNPTIVIDECFEITPDKQSIKTNDSFYVKLLDFGSYDLSLILEPATLTYTYEINVSDGKLQSATLLDGSSITYSYNLHYNDVISDIVTSPLNVSDMLSITNTVNETYKYIISMIEYSDDDYTPIDLSDGMMPLANIKVNVIVMRANETGFNPNSEESTGIIIDGTRETVTVDMIGFNDEELRAGYDPNTGMFYLPYIDAEYDLYLVLDEYNKIMVYSFDNIELYTVVLDKKSTEIKSPGLYYGLAGEEFEITIDMPNAGYNLVAPESSEYELDEKVLRIYTLDKSMTISLDVDAKYFSVLYYFLEDGKPATIDLGSDLGQSDYVDCSYKYNDILQLNYYKGFIVNVVGRGLVPVESVEIKSDLLDENRMPAYNVEIDVNISLYLLTTSIPVNIYKVNDDNTKERLEITRDNLVISSDPTTYVEHPSAILSAGEAYPGNGQYAPIFGFDDSDMTTIYVLFKADNDQYLLLFSGLFQYNRPDSIEKDIVKVTYLVDNNSDVTDISFGDGTSSYESGNKTAYWTYSTGGGYVEGRITTNTNGYYIEDTDIAEYFEGPNGKTYTIAIVPSTNINIDLVLGKKTFHINYFKNESEYNNASEYYHESDLYAKQYYLFLDSINYPKNDVDTLNGLFLYGWIDASTGLEISLLSMPDHDIDVYGIWKPLMKHTISIRLYEGYSNVAYDGLLILSTSRTEIIEVTTDVDKYYSYEYVARYHEYVFTHNPNNNYYIWISFDDGKKQYLTDEAAATYTYYKLKLEGLGDHITTDDSLYIAASEIDTTENIRGKVTINLNIERGYYATSDNVFAEVYNDVLVIQNFLNVYIDTFTISAKMTDYYIYYLHDNGKLWKRAVYHYLEPILEENYPTNGFKFIGWTDLSGNVVELMQMQDEDITVIAKVSRIRESKVRMTPIDGLELTDIFLSSSSEIVSNRVDGTLNGDMITFDYSGIYYVWISDPYTGQDKYLGIQADAELNLEFRLVEFANDYEHITSDNIGYRLINNLIPINIECAPGYGFELNSLGVMVINTNKVTLPNDSSTIVTIDLTEIHIIYHLYYFIEDRLEEVVEYYYDDPVELLDYSLFEERHPSFVFAGWSTAITTMPNFDINVYAQTEIPYSEFIPPTISKIHEGQMLADARITGGSLYINGVLQTGRYSFKTPTVVPTKADSLSTEYVLIFTPSDEGYVPYKFNVTIEVCNPRFSAEDLDEPILVDRTDTTINFYINPAYDYSLNNGLSYNAGGDVVVNNLLPGKSIDILYRYREDDTYCFSEIAKATFRTLTESEMIYGSACKDGLNSIINAEGTIDNESARSFISYYKAVFARDYSEDIDVYETQDLVHYVTDVLDIIVMIEEYRTTLSILNSTRIRKFADDKLDEIIDLANNNINIESIVRYNNYILGVFDSCDDMLSSFDVNIDDLFKEAKNRRLRQVNLDNAKNESLYVISKVDELLEYGYDDHGKINLDEYKTDYVGATVSLMNKASSMIHTCDGKAVQVLVGDKVSAVQGLTYMDYKFDRAKYDEEFYNAAEAAIIAHLQGVVLNIIDTQYDIKLATIKDLSKVELLRIVYLSLKDEYSDFESFKQEYYNLIGTDGSVTYDDLVDLFQDKISDSLVVPITGGLSDVEIILIFVFISSIAAVGVAVVVVNVIKRRGVVNAK